MLVSGLGLIFLKRSLGKDGTMVKNLLSLFLTMSVLLPVAALAGVEPDYQSGEPRAVMPWYETVTAQSRGADYRFIKGMRPHHAGALTMAEDYLSQSSAQSPLLKQLARGIVRNQTFEIGMLDTVEERLKASEGQDGRSVVALKGLSQREQFYRAPVPGFLDNNAPRDFVSVTDVKFAKAMIVHHEAALVMCRDYLKDRAVNNGYVELMCRDILLDQAQEIALMNTIIGRYPGDADQIAFDPSMVHGMEGMEGMSHGSHAAHKKHH